MVGRGGNVLPSFPKMFGVWLTKHVTKSCATNRHLAGIDNSVQNICPSCGKPDETTYHITQRQEDGRTEMLRRSIQAAIDYLEDSHSDPELIDMLDKYLWAQGT